jgi:hypothetical protein
MDSDSRRNQPWEIFENKGALISKSTSCNPQEIDFNISMKITNDNQKFPKIRKQGHF